MRTPRPRRTTVGWTKGRGAGGKGTDAFRKHEAWVQSQVVNEAAKSYAENVYDLSHELNETRSTAAQRQRRLARLQEEAESVDSANTRSSASLGDLANLAIAEIVIPPLDDTSTITLTGQVVLATDDVQIVEDAWCVPSTLEF